jgi:hypothetical protein
MDGHPGGYAMPEVRSYLVALPTASAADQAGKLIARHTYSTQELLYQQRDRNLRVQLLERLFAAADLRDAKPGWFSFEGKALADPIVIDAEKLFSADEAVLRAYYTNLFQRFREQKGVWVADPLKALLVKLLADFVNSPLANNKAELDARKAAYFPSDDALPSPLYLKAFKLGLPSGYQAVFDELNSPSAGARNAAPGAVNTDVPHGYYQENDKKQRIQLLNQLFALGNIRFSALNKKVVPSRVAIDAAQLFQEDKASQKDYIKGLLAEFLKKKSRLGNDALYEQLKALLDECVSKALATMSADFTTIKGELTEKRKAAIKAFSTDVPKADLRGKYQPYFDGLRVAVENIDRGFSAALDKVQQTDGAKLEEAKCQQLADTLGLDLAFVMRHPVAAIEGTFPELMGQINPPTTYTVPCTFSAQKCVETKNAYTDLIFPEVRRIIAAYYKVANEDNATEESAVTRKLKGPDNGSVWVRLWFTCGFTWERSSYTQIREPLAELHRNASNGKSIPRDADFEQLPGKIDAAIAALKADKTKKGRAALSRLYLLKRQLDLYRVSGDEVGRATALSSSAYAGEVIKVAVSKTKQRASAGAGASSSSSSAQSDNNVMAAYKVGRQTAELKITSTACSLKTNEEVEAFSFAVMRQLLTKVVSVHSLKDIALDLRKGGITTKVQSLQNCLAIIKKQAESQSTAKAKAEALRDPAAKELAREAVRSVGITKDQQHAFSLMAFAICLLPKAAGNVLKTALKSPEAGFRVTGELKAALYNSAPADRGCINCLFYSLPVAFKTSGFSEGADLIANLALNDLQQPELSPQRNSSVASRSPGDSNRDTCSGDNTPSRGAGGWFGGANKTEDARYLESCTALTAVTQGGKATDSLENFEAALRGLVRDTETQRAVLYAFSVSYAAQDKKHTLVLHLSLAMMSAYVSNFNRQGLAASGAVAERVLLAALPALLLKLNEDYQKLAAHRLTAPVADSSDSAAVAEFQKVRQQLEASIVDTLECIDDAVRHSSGPYVSELKQFFRFMAPVLPETTGVTAASAAGSPGSQKPFEHLSQRILRRRLLNRVGKIIRATPEDQNKMRVLVSKNNGKSSHALDEMGLLLSWYRQYSANHEINVNGVMVKDRLDLAARLGLAEERAQDLVRQVEKLKADLSPGRCTRDSLRLGVKNALSDFLVAVMKLFEPSDKINSLNAFGRELNALLVQALGDRLIPEDIATACKVNAKDPLKTQLSQEALGRYRAPLAIPAANQPAPPATPPRVQVGAQPAGSAAANGVAAHSSVFSPAGGIAAGSSAVSGGMLSGWGAMFSSPRKGASRSVLGATPHGSAEKPSAGGGSGYAAARSDSPPR